MAPAPKVELSEYERKRQETIAKNQALLRNLALDAANAGLAPTKARSSTTGGGSTGAKKKKPAVKKEKPEIIPVRKSSRLLGIVADSEVAKRKAEEEADLRQVAERAKKQRISGDLKAGDILVGDGKHWDANGNFLSIVGPAQPYQRTFDPEDVKEATSKELRALQERMNNLQLWEGWEPSRIKVTPERIYSMAMHPTREKPLAFAGDKLGHLGIFDASQKVPEVKQEDEEAEDGEDEPVITTLKPHTRTISSFQFTPHDSNSVLTASYDSSIRKFDLSKGVSIVVYEPKDADEDFPISGVEMARDNPNTVYFTSLGGQFGLHDMRAPPNNTGGTQILNLSEKKIGGFSLHPQHSHILATASLDRMLKVWDLRKISGKDEWRIPALVGEHESRLSVSHASFNGVGQVATSSYDDTVKLYDFTSCGDWKIGTTLTEKQMEPATVVPHNNQTGRWVTILKPQWQLYPEDNLQRFVIGNMNRFVDVYTGNGEQLAQLGGDGITAVPAVAVFHQTQDWIAAGTASGKLCLWM